LHVSVRGCRIKSGMTVRVVETQFRHPGLDPGSCAVGFAR
jgi:hypothetical protein